MNRRAHGFSLIHGEPTRHHLDFMLSAMAAWDATFVRVTSCSQQELGISILIRYVCIHNQFYARFSSFDAIS